MKLLPKQGVALGALVLAGSTNSFQSPPQHRISQNSFSQKKVSQQSSLSRLSEGKHPHEPQNNTNGKLDDLFEDLRKAKSHIKNRLKSIIDHNLNQAEKAGDQSLSELLNTGRKLGAIWRPVLKSFLNQTIELLKEGNTTIDHYNPKLVNYSKELLNYIEKEIHQVHEKLDHQDSNQTQSDQDANASS